MLDPSPEVTSGVACGIALARDPNRLDQLLESALVQGIQVFIFENPTQETAHTVEEETILDAFVAFPKPGGQDLIDFSRGRWRQDADRG